MLDFPFKSHSDHDDHLVTQKKKQKLAFQKHTSGSTFVMRWHKKGLTWMYRTSTCHDFLCFSKRMTILDDKCVSVRSYLASGFLPKKIKKKWKNEKTKPSQQRIPKISTRWKPNKFTHAMCRWWNKYLRFHILNDQVEVLSMKIHPQHLYLSHLKSLSWKSSPTMYTNKMN